MTGPTPDPETDPETVRVTYAELAQARGVSIAAARKLTLRHRWPKQIGNDGLTHVLAPVSFMEDSGRDMAPAFDDAVIEAIAEATTVSVTGALSDLRTVLPSLQEAITTLRAELMAPDAVIEAIAEATTVSVTEALSDLRTVLPSLQEAITTLRMELDAQRDRADRAEKRVQELEARRWWLFRRVRQKSL
jgi:hypothetical protein